MNKIDLEKQLEIQKAFEMLAQEPIFKGFIERALVSNLNEQELKEYQASLADYNKSRNI